MTKSPIKIAVTGAAGQISYSLLFRIAAGDLFGKEQPVILQCLELEQALPALNGVVMELNDCAFPLLNKVIVTSDPNVAFSDVDCAFLVGAKPRGKGMERSDLLQANAKIFSEQGKALNFHAKKNVRVLVVGNPANTNALITQENAPNINPRQINAMMRLDHNRAISQLAAHKGVPVNAVRQVIVWGNHSASQYPDCSHALVNKEPIKTNLENRWIVEDFIPTVAKRGAAIIEARGASSAASAASAAIDHMRDWVLGTKDDTWVSMGVPSDGSYGIPSGIVYGFPCRCNNGEYEIVQGLEIDDFSRERMQKSADELLEEKAAIADLL